MRGKCLLLVVPLSWAGLWTGHLEDLLPDLRTLVHGRDEYSPGDVDYVFSFRPPPGFLKTLSNLRVVFSLGAGVDGFLSDPEYPKHVPLVRFADPSLAREMAEYVVLHILMHFRMQRQFDRAQAEHKWRPMLLPHRAHETRIGILGLGDIGSLIAERLLPFGFQIAGWSRSRKSVAGVESFAGDEELAAFLARSDVLMCVLPLTPETRGIMNAKLFAQLPTGAFVINVARGGHLIESDLISALDSGHLAGATLDVFETEPLPETSPLWAHPKVTVTPHVAAITEPRIAAQYVADRIAQFERGENLDNVVDLDRGY